MELLFDHKDMEDMFEHFLRARFFSTGDLSEQISDMCISFAETSDNELPKEFTKYDMEEIAIFAIRTYDYPMDKVIHYSFDFNQMIKYLKFLKTEEGNELRIFKVQQLRLPQKERQLHKLEENFFIDTDKLNYYS